MNRTTELLVLLVQEKHLTTIKILRKYSKLTNSQRPWKYTSVNELVTVFVSYTQLIAQRDFSSREITFRKHSQGPSSGGGLGGAVQQAVLQEKDSIFLYSLTDCVPR